MENVTLPETVEQLTRAGPATPMGELLRRYWQPIALSADVLADEAPVAVKILGEDLVLLRDTDGKPGLIGRHCAHRGADLRYGRVEAGGLRCLYHGWLFDRQGRCLEQPGEPSGGEYRDKVRQLAYPCADLAETVWVYMGPGEPPCLPSHPALDAPPEYRIATRFQARCNFLQGLEGGLDPVHTSYLHRFIDRPDNDSEAALNEVFQANTAPRLHVSDSPVGFRIVAERVDSDEARKVLRLSNFIMPNASMVNGFDTPLGPGGATLTWVVPIDDTHHWRFEYTFHSTKPLNKEYIAAVCDAEKLPGEVLKRSADNNYLQDREEMKATTFAGMGHCILAQDVMIIEGQGAIHDQTKEHLVTSDVAIVRARRMLLEAMEIVAGGGDPLGVVREEGNDALRHTVAGTKTVDLATGNEQFCSDLEQADLYALGPL